VFSGHSCLYGAQNCFSRYLEIEIVHLYWAENFTDSLITLDVFMAKGTVSFSTFSTERKNQYWLDFFRV
jgi:hypothetical protein